MESTPARARILVCGADPSFRGVVKKVLGAESDRADFFEDPAEVLDRISSGSEVILVDPTSVTGGLDGFLDRLARRPTLVAPVVIRSNGPSAPHGLAGTGSSVLYYLSKDQFDTGLLMAVDMAAQLAIECRHRTEIEHQLTGTERMLGQLINVSRELSGHKDLDSLLEAILTVSRVATQADSGSIYLVEEHREKKAKILRFRIPQNDSLSVHLSNHTLPLDHRSVAGHVALSSETIMLEDSYRLPEGAPYVFDKAWDERTGYLSRSMLVVPMRGHNKQTLGIIQLINKKTERDVRIRAKADVEQYVRSFSRRDADLIEAIASQASVAVENLSILEDMMRLFDGFVAASARAVECMDSATGGHCERLAQYMVNTAIRINGITDGPLARFKFDRAALKELRYAALMHDIGKIGVRESVLKKDRRLTDDRLELIKMRFRYFKEVLKHKAFRQAMNSIFSGGGRAVNLGDVEKNLENQVRELDEILDYICQINTLARMDDKDLEKLKSISQTVLTDVDGQEHQYLTADEFENLSVRRGNLTPKERKEIEEHVVLTYKILASIPWLPEYRRVPEIAGTHHERIDGSGYPSGIRGDEIPVGGQILAMIDIYEALTASDRPYKPPVTPEKALRILELEAKDGHLNPDIVRLFIDQEIYKTVELPPSLTERTEGSTKEAW